MSRWRQRWSRRSPLCANRSISWASIAATVLLDQLEAGSEGKVAAEGQHIVLPTELVIRESCGQERRFALGHR